MIRRLLFFLLFATPCSAQWYAGAGYQQSISTTPIMRGGALYLGTRIGSGWVFGQLTLLPASSDAKPIGGKLGTEETTNAMSDRTSDLHSEYDGFQFRFSVSYLFEVNEWLLLGPTLGVAPNHELWVGYLTTASTPKQPITYGAFYEKNSIAPNIGAGAKFGSYKDHGMLISVDFGTMTGIGAGLMIPL